MFHKVVDQDDITFGTTNQGGRELNMCGYTYQIKRENEETIRWRCIVRTAASQKRHFLMKHFYLDTALAIQKAEYINSDLFNKSLRNSAFPVKLNE
jgi:hypothetical protein